VPPFNDFVEKNLQINAREYAGKELVLESFPYEVQIGADNRCNLRCGFCLADAYRERGKLHIQDRKLSRNPIEIFQAVAPFMRYWKFLSLTGPGESLLNPKIGQILQLVRDNSSCSIMVTTNGVLINQRLAAIFSEFEVDEIAISLDSLDKDNFEALRVNGKFEKAIRAIDLLNEEKSKRGKEIPRVNLTPTFFRRNIAELPLFIDFARQKQIHLVQASPGQIYRPDWVEESLLHFPELTRKMALRAEQKAEQLGVNFVNNLRMVYVNRGNRLLRLFRGRETLDFPTDPSQCLKPWTSLFIEPDGEVRPCCYLSPILGNIYETNLPQIWNGEAARSLRAAMFTGDLPTLCRDCYEFNRHKPDIMISLE
jgi:radical SAM protein with 4Fe4S-binding SPASM domain